jgi:hypothetical protein
MELRHSCRNLAKVKVASSSLVSRSKFFYSVSHLQGLS